MFDVMAVISFDKKWAGGGISIIFISQYFAPLLLCLFVQFCSLFSMVQFSELQYFFNADNCRNGKSIVTASVVKSNEEGGVTES